MAIKIYTDGGCSGNPGPGGWAYIVVSEVGNTILYEKNGGEKNTTNNRMELTAVISALSALCTPNVLSTPNVLRDADDAPNNVPSGLVSGGIMICTDSKYVETGITEWIHNWKRKGWKTTAKKDVLNRDLWEKLDSLNSKLKVKWEWVKGHAGNPLNERADSLVQEAIKRV
jgi:ribonuclease HI